MQAGATRDWRQLIREATGEELSAKAIIEYYSPLIKYLQEQNTGREIGFPAQPRQAGPRAEPSQTGAEPYPDLAERERIGRGGTRLGTVFWRAIKKGDPAFGRAAPKPTMKTGRRPASANRP